MNSREIEQLEKKSVYCLHINEKIKDSCIQSDINEMSKVMKQLVKKKNLIVFVIEEK